MNKNQKTNLNYQNDVSTSMNFIVKDIALKSLLFAMVFYILNSNLINKLLQYLDKFPFIERNFIQAIIFGLVFYMISVNL